MTATLPTTPIPKTFSGPRKRPRSPSPPPVSRKTKIVSVDDGSRVAIPVKTAPSRPRRPDTPRPSTTFTFGLPFIVPTSDLPHTPRRLRKLPRRGTPHPKHVIPPNSAANPVTVSRAHGASSDATQQRRAIPPSERRLIGCDIDGEPMYRDELSDYLPPSDELDTEDALAASAEREWLAELRRQHYSNQPELATSQRHDPTTPLNARVPVHVARRPWDYQEPHLYSKLPLVRRRKEPTGLEEPPFKKDEPPYLGTPTRRYTLDVSDEDPEEDDENNFGDDEASSPVKWFGLKRRRGRI